CRPATRPDGIFNGKNNNTPLSPARREHAHDIKIKLFLPSSFFKSCRLARGQRQTEGLKIKI
ncbi:MAG: hypothetical protein RSF79_27760, partial [Janthinobacterium sp.]